MISHTSPLHKACQRLNSTHLDVAERLFGDEADVNGEKVIGVAGDCELHGTRFVGSIDDRKTPL